MINLGSTTSMSALQTKLHGPTSISFAWLELNTVDFSVPLASLEFKVHHINDFLKKESGNPFISIYVTDVLSLTTSSIIIRFPAKLSCQKVSISVADVEDRLPPLKVYGHPLSCMFDRTVGFNSFHMKYALNTQINTTLNQY